ncbi:hypothetical protein C7974DRAFT_1020 [Boeremia exigua]|uniref:uncharacterized protein n=1 Tax=Boeremia exigua TaxID=749465 RepID=UPI001E8DBD52|nr:uncharacterized protein C7974DRAFT_1020 [Boeremia exigua]KAH6643579.1 hypothetical protein C7974DRAFT_1020 [Boeremia exigua]
MSKGSSMQHPSYAPRRCCFMVFSPLFLLSDAPVKDQKLCVEREQQLPIGYRNGGGSCRRGWPARLVDSQRSERNQLGMQQAWTRCSYTTLLNNAGKLLGCARIKVVLVHCRLDRAFWLFWSSISTCACCHAAPQYLLALCSKLGCNVSK